MSSAMSNIFQFHKGTIKTNCLYSPESIQQHFNSIKVQLKPLDKNTVSPLLLFQFHKGTIKTLQSVPTNGQSQLFQFHKGTIKTTEYCITFNYLLISIP